VDFARFLRKIPEMDEPERRKLYRRAGSERKGR
jgi:hypothetical protein